MLLHFFGLAKKLGRKKTKKVNNKLLFLLPTGVDLASFGWVVKKVRRGNWPQNSATELSHWIQPLNSVAGFCRQLGFSCQPHFSAATLFVSMDKIWLPNDLSTAFRRFQKLSKRKKGQQLNSAAGQFPRPNINNTFTLPTCLTSKLLIYLSIYLTAAFCKSGWWAKIKFLDFPLCRYNWTTYHGTKSAFAGDGGRQDLPWLSLSLSLKFKLKRTRFSWPMFTKEVVKIQAFTNCLHDLFQLQF